MRKNYFKVILVLVMSFSNSHLAFCENEFEGSGIEVTAKRELILPLKDLENYYDGKVEVSFRVTVYTGWSLQDLTFFKKEDGSWKFYSREGLGRNVKLGSSHVTQAQRAEDFLKEIKLFLEGDFVSEFKEKSTKELSIDDGLNMVIALREEDGLTYFSIKALSLSQSGSKEIVKIGKLMDSFLGKAKGTVREKQGEGE